MPKVFSQNIFTDFSAENEVATFSISERFYSEQITIFFTYFMKSSVKSMVQK